MNINDILATEKRKKPLDNFVTDGGFCSIFRTICCVGDSLSSGEFEGTNDEGNKTYHDFFTNIRGDSLSRVRQGARYTIFQKAV
ncbi:MAG: hypothetical protein L6V93_21315 [Clostridiales bacterium]|nr:MAG: hypothetical protein L6V93_21315 [Clostridiales bacterium]